VDEAALVAAARRDVAAFAPLYTRYLGPVYGYCLGSLGDREAAEDATSLTFVKALAALPRFDGRAFRPWLFAIAHNVVVDAARARQLHQPIGAAIDVADRSPSPEELAVAAEAGRTIQAQLPHLSPDQRAVIQLRLSGLTDQEIATVLGRSHGAIRTAQHRAVSRLRDLLGAAPVGEVPHGRR
jgi:RNA polymerase sigma-70 factor (ECF subfamily)